MYNIYTANVKSDTFQPSTFDVENSDVYGLLVPVTDIKALIDIKLKLAFFFFFLNLKR